VYGWFGGFKGMARKGKGKGDSMRDASVEKAAGRSKNLPGGGIQFYIPNLKYAQVKMQSLKAI
jgi:hypothetical protein